MDVLDPTEEWRRLTELYRQMTDDELLAIAQKQSELTDVAQPLLIQEMSLRGLEMPRDEQFDHPPPPPEADTDDPYAEDRQLITYCKVWSVEDALQVQRLLDTAGIPFYMGGEKATGVDQVTSNYAEGVDVQIMRIGIPWARNVMQYYVPLNEPAQPEEAGPEDLAVHCPKCHSEEVVFGDESTGPRTEETEKFKWTCDSCGHHWEDDGIETEQ